MRGRDPSPLVSALRTLAEQRADGALHVAAEDGRSARLFLAKGEVYALSVPGVRPRVGARLVSAGSLACDSLARALDLQREAPEEARIGELLVRHGYTTQDLVDTVLREQLEEAFADLLALPAPTCEFHEGEHTREDVTPPVAVEALLERLGERSSAWAQIRALVPGPMAVPALRTGGTAPDALLDPDAWTLLCRIDGERTVAELAHACGYTLFEAGQVLVRLAHAGLVAVPPDEPAWPAELALPAPLPTQPPAGVPDIAAAEEQAWVEYAVRVRQEAADDSAATETTAAVRALLSELAAEEVAPLAVDVETLDDAEPDESDEAPAPEPLEPPYPAETPARAADSVAGSLPIGPGPDRDQTDTAALLRELSSLGVEESDPAEPTPAPPRPGSGGGERKPRRRGLFGL